VGVGALTALTFVLTLEDPRRFAKSRAVGAYLGLGYRAKTNRESVIPKKSGSPRRVMRC
jgi:transposase